MRNVIKKIKDISKFFIRIHFQNLFIIFVFIKKKKNEKYRIFLMIDLERKIHLFD